MKKNTKKLSKPEKDNLKFLVEDFLEMDEDALLKGLKETSDKGKGYFVKLHTILCKGFHFPGDPDEEDMTDGDFEKLVQDLHKALKPTWKKIKKALLHFQEEINPIREDSRKLKLDILSDKIDKKDPWYEFRELGLQDSPADDEKYYGIKFQDPFGQYFISFETGSINFYRAPDQPQMNFLDLFKDTPISYFSRCAYEKCRKVIIITRKNKKFCTVSNCAARKFQAEKWKKDEDGMKKAEKERYHTKRKKTKQ